MDDAEPLMRQHLTDAGEVDAAKTPTVTVELTERELDIITEPLFNAVCNDYYDAEKRDADTVFNRLEAMRVKLAEERMRSLQK